MTKRPPSRPLWLIRAEIILSITIILLTFLMFVPIHTALSAGLASVSLVIFGVAILLVLTLMFIDHASHRLLLRGAMIAAILGCFVPQLAFIGIARNASVHLSFDPVSYVTFSGVTTVSPTKLITYKHAGSHDLKLAYYPTKQPGLRPAVALLHGGGWRYGNHLETGNWPRVLNQAGFTVISIEYRLSNNTYHSWLDTPADVHDAMIYIKSHASELRLNPSQMHLLGQSAGGHLALLEAYRHPDLVSVISLYAPIDPTLDYATSRDKSAELDFIGGPPNQFANRYTQVSPLTYVSRQSPRTLLIQGERDDFVAAQNAISLSATLTSYDVDHTLTLLPFTGHSFENQRGGFATQIAEQKVRAFLLR